MLHVSHMENLCQNKYRNSLIDILISIYTLSFKYVLRDAFLERFYQKRLTSLGCYGNTWVNALYWSMRAFLWHHLISDAF